MPYTHKTIDLQTPSHEAPHSCSPKTLHPPDSTPSDSGAGDPDGSLELASVAPSI